MPKEKSVNPATAHLKAEKAKALKKGKAAVAAQRTARLSTRNPTRLTSQIEELKSLSASRPLTAREKKQLETLEADVKRVLKAKETLGVSNTQPRGGGSFDRGRGSDRGRGRGGPSGALGKRRRDGSYADGSNSPETSETDDDVRGIPWPRDTPPPIPESHQHLVRKPAHHTENPNEVPLGDMKRGPHALPPKPQVLEVTQAQVVYSSAPQLRDLRKEATRFAPVAVQRKLKLAKGEGTTLVDEEEREVLEKEGYAKAATGEDGLDEEEARFLQEVEAVGGGKEEGETVDGKEGAGDAEIVMKGVQIEDGPDEDG